MLALIVLMSTAFAEATLSEDYDDTASNDAGEKFMKRIPTYLKELESAQDSDGTNPAKRDNLCPTGFKRYLAHGGCYKVQFDKLAWWDAALRCRSYHKDAHLVVINSEQKQYYVQSLLSYENVAELCETSPQHDPTVANIWTAGQRLNPYSKNANSPFMFRPLPGQDETAMTYTNWGRNQPQNWNNGTWEACVTLKSTDDYRWHDYPCETNACSLCELDWQYV